MHPFPRGSPIIGQYEPTGHSLHAADEIAPGVLLYVPAEHGEHTVAPAILYVPTGQIVYTLPPVLGQE